MREETPQRRGRGRPKSRKNMSAKREPLTVRLTVIYEDEPSPEYLALWRRLLLPHLTDAKPES